jgi:hypothetical protein
MRDGQQQPLIFFARFARGPRFCLLLPQKSSNISSTILFVLARFARAPY